MDHGDSENEKGPSQIEMIIKTEVDVAATSPTHIYIETDLNNLKLEPGLVQSVKCEPILIKEEVLEGSGRGDNEQQSVQDASTAAGPDIVNEGCSTSRDDLCNVKQELGNIDIGPVVFQHMDIHYVINKNMSAVTEDNMIVDDCNETMPGSGVKKESLEDKLRASRKHSSQKTTEDDYDEAHLKSCPRQQMNLQQHRFNCYRTIRKPHLLSAHDTVNHQNSKKDFMITSSVVPAISNQFEKPYWCETCGARFKHRCLFTRHMRVHTGEKPYRCETCDARFKDRGNLTRHMKVHTGEKPYRCETCDAKFSQKSHLIIHMGVHSGEKPFRCVTCDARFKRRRPLTIHMGVHSGEKPYQCECDARFKHRTALIRHMRVHTGKKPYGCETCDARYKDRSTLTCHMRVHTSESTHVKLVMQDLNTVKH